MVNSGKSLKIQKRTQKKSPGIRKGGKAISKGKSAAAKKSGKTLNLMGRRKRAKGKGNDADTGAGGGRGGRRPFNRKRFNKKA